MNNSTLLEDITNKHSKICVIGLGYVGLPIALEFARKVSVIGFDINAQRVEDMRNNIDPSKELEAEDFKDCDIYFTHETSEIAEAKFFVVAVPTPIDDHKQPDLKPLLSACRTVGKVLKQGDYVVFESTVYPGCTEDDCVPILEAESGLRYKQDFKVGYSPERINPGDKEHTLTKITKVVSGCDAESLDIIAEVYSLIIDAGVYRASSIPVAEAAKVIENTQRDLNIALMNELSVIFGKLGINTYDVLEAAGTKWNFLKFTPGLVGGHCIGVDPYYLTYKANQLGYHSKVILSGRNINDNMGAFIARQVVQFIIEKDKSLKQAKVLVMGVTFKENVSDIRNSKVADVVNELKSYKLQVDVVDPYADSQEVDHEYGFALSPQMDNDYDAIVLAVGHQEYTGKSEDFFQQLSNEKTLLYDVKGIYRGQIHDLTYESL